MKKSGDDMPAPPAKPGSGILIAVEGIDGTGKSTQLRLLTEELAADGYAVVGTREPSHGPYGQKIRQLYSDRGRCSPEEELALFIMDRRDHVRDTVLPALRQGKIVVTDRYYYSTAAYQGARGLNPQAIIRENEAFAPRPNLVLLLVQEPALSLCRIRQLRHESPNDFEQEESLVRVAQVFAGFSGDHIRRIDASRDVRQVHASVMAEVERLLTNFFASGAAG